MLISGLLCLFFASTAMAVDKSGVKPSVLSLPSGPGSIEGLGESFAPQLNSGTASYSVTLKTLPGRNGFAPKLSLSYNSGSGNGLAGLGWKLSLLDIQRQTDKGLPYYTDWPQKDGVDNDFDGTVDEDDEFDRLIFGGDELIPVADGSWRPKNEGSFVKVVRSGLGWQVSQPNGTQLFFGLSGATQIVSNGRIFKWLLEKSEDRHGNQILYQYTALDDSSQRYLHSIRYNHDMNILFSYETREDIVSDYRPRFELKTAWRLNRVTMKRGAKQVRAYALGYVANTSQPQPSLLSQITQVGSDNLSTLPPAEFSYTPFVGSSAQPVSLLGTPQINLNDGNVDLVDINSDGLPDILDANDVVHDYYLNLGANPQGIVQWSARTSMVNSPALMRLGASNVQLADMDGDGRINLMNIQGRDVNYFKVQSNAQGYSWVQSGVRSMANFNFQNANTKLVDVNNDKLIDVVKTSSFDILVSLNSGSGRWSNPISQPLPNPNLQLDSAVVRLADMNGDRLQDLLWIQSDLAVYYPSRGMGEFGAAIIMDNPPFGVINNQNLVMADLNGDGLSDAAYVTGNSVRVWLNAGLNPGDHSRARFANSFQVLSPFSNSLTTFRIADMNGNGSTDIVWNTLGGGADTLAYLDFAPQEQPYQLKRLSNGIGQVTTIYYGSTTQEAARDRDAGKPWPTTLPFPISVIRRIEVSDGQNRYQTELAYHDGFYDGSEKEFRGFAAAEKQELGDASVPTLISAFSYHTGALIEALKGKPQNLTTKNSAGEVFYREQYDWATRQLLASSFSGEQVTFAYQQSKSRQVIEKGQSAPVSLQWDYEYDDYGNQIKQVEHGRLDAGWDDERITTTRYSAACQDGLNNWLLSLPVEQTVSDEFGTKVSQVKSYYDKNAAACQLSKGDLTLQKNWVSGSNYIASTRSDYDQWGNVVASYDPLYGAEAGHYRHLTYDTLYHTFPIGEAIHTGSRFLTMSASYDFGFGVMLSSSDFNQQVSRYYYDVFGRLSKSVKPGDTVTKPTLEYRYVLNAPLGAGKSINWVETRQRESRAGGTLDSRAFYDGLGRKVMTRSEGESAGQVVVSDTVQFNGRKQPWRQYLPYFEVGSLDFVAPAFRAAFVEYQYDALGRQIKMTQPDGRFSRIYYAPLSRTIQDEEQSALGGLHYGAGMRYVEDGLLDRKGKGRLREVYEKVKLNDVGEALAAVVEWPTRYRYDLLDNLTGYTDSQNNQKRIQYDGLGRKVFMDDPDRGELIYKYDAAGNLRKTLDAKGQTIRFSYDGVNRLTAEYYSAKSSQADVEYHYDEPWGAVSRGDYWAAGAAQKIVSSILTGATFQTALDKNGDQKVDVADVVLSAKNALAAAELQAVNTLGHLSWVKDLSGEEHNSYDERGRVNWVIKRIDDGQGQLTNFYTGMNYDSADRVTALIYPDQTRLNYYYNNRGLLESLSGVVDRVDYNPVGQNAYLGLANGVSTRYVYDVRQRLSNLSSQRLSDGLTLQGLTYAYDGVSNITGIVDGRSSGVLSQIGGELGVNKIEAAKFNASQAFQYDSLYRLTQASSPAIYGTVNYRYDRIGNMVNKNARLIEQDPLMDLGQMSSGGTAGTWNRIGRATGDAPGPHAVTGTEKGTAGAMLFDYDANGNMTSDGGMSLQWDSKDRLTKLVNGLQGAEYAYDYSGSRKRKQVINSQNGRSSTVFYIDKYSEIRDGQLIKYAYAGANRIAQSTSISEGGSSFVADVFYLHDHLGSTNLSLNATGSVQEQMVNWPFGHKRKNASKQVLAHYQFTGKEQDKESGLQYFEARYLSSYLGRFSTPDPLLSTSMSRKHLVKPGKLNIYHYGSNNPINFIDPTGYIEQKSTNIPLADVTAAKLANGVGEEGFEGADGYKLVRNHDSDTGLQAGLFEKDGKYVLAYAGTNQWSDLWTDLKQAFGFKSAQYSEGIRLGVRYSMAYKNLSFVGHSLGGGLAAAASAVTGRKATVFNAAGVHENTVARYGVKLSSSSVTYYYSDFDALRFLNAITPASVPGRRVSLGMAGFHQMDDIVDAMK